MSKTPRTDLTGLYLRHYQRAAAHIEWERHARELETELGELQEAVRSFRDVVGRHHTQQAAERLILMLPEANKP